MSSIDALLERSPSPLISTPAALVAHQPGIHRQNAAALTIPVLDPAQQGQKKQPDLSSRVRRDCVNTRPVVNRIFAVMMHTTRYAFKAQARLAADCQVSPSTISRLLTGFSSPSFVLVDTVTKALEKQLKFSLDPRELISVDGDFPTRFTCSLCHCTGCLPYEAWDENDLLRPEYMDVRPGEWTLLSVQSVRKSLLEEQLIERGEGR